MTEWQRQQTICVKIVRATVHAVGSEGSLLGSQPRGVSPLAPLPQVGLYLEAIAGESGVFPQGNFTDELFGR